MSENGDIASEHSWLLPRLWAAFLLVLISVTPRLWLIPAVAGDMPRIPLFGGLDPAAGLPSDFAAIAASYVVMAGLLLVVINARRFRKSWWLVSVGFCVAFVMDQHRLQPWAYQGAVYALIFATMDQRTARRWLIPMAASVYLYSAAGKLDYQFAHTVGQDFLDTIAQPFGGLPQLDDSARAKLALIFPSIEFAAGVGLLIRPARRLAAVVVIGMHASLVAILGPWGLDHSNGVLIWNILLIIQAGLLFLPKSIEPETPLPTDAGSGAWFTKGIVVLALVAPLFERQGYWDHWTSWSLYSPHTSRVEIEIHESAIALIDPLLHPLVHQTDADADGWYSLDIERWSLENRAVPIYPQARYQLALAAKFAAQQELDEEIRARERGVADRWNGRRKEKRMLGRREIVEGLQNYWLTR